MDAAEADSDVKLYKASAELLQEIQEKLPRLVQNPARPGTFRRWIIDSKAHEVAERLDRFQEWPQLLDPYLADLIHVLVDAYLSYCVSCPDEYNKGHGSVHDVSPLPRVVARLLYAFCKVRGRKVIVRLLNNEPKYIEPLISCFRLWTSNNDHKGSSAPANMTWEERYILLLWLAHLMLAPFELSTISGLSTSPSDDPTLSQLFSGLPKVSVNLAMIALDHLYVPSKAREAASILLVRLSWRSDMQKLGLAERLVEWNIHQLNPPPSQEDKSGYRFIGLLSLLFGIMNTASDSEALPFIQEVFDTAHKAATSFEGHSQKIRDSAPARKLLVKVMRSTVVHSLSLSNNNHVPAGHSLDTDSMLEECIQTMLDYLGDKDTPVRQAASKALSMVCLELDPEMSAEVVEAVIDCLHENMLLEDVQDGKLFPFTDVSKRDSVKYKKNVNAVDPLKWHGAMLTLGHLLFRRSLPTTQLSAVVEVLLMGLNFEQRSNVGTSIGVGVRDAACFGIWSLARKYSTVELDNVSVARTTFLGSTLSPDADQDSILQLIASQLSVSACLDPSGNLRRGSSAALQELIGRHPDAIAEGIPVVQTIDYHAVARRSRATTEVAVAASKLSRHYHHALLYGLLEWRGARATDAESRRQAAQAVGLLVSMASRADVLAFLQELSTQIQRLKTSNSGTNAAARHGLLLSLASAVEVLRAAGNRQSRTGGIVLIRPIVDDLASIIGDIDGRVTTDIENVLEAVSKVITALASLLSALSENPSASPEAAAWASSIFPILERCTTASDRGYVAEAAAEANLSTLKLLNESSQMSAMESQLDQKQQKQTTFTCRGRIATLGQALGYVVSVPSLEPFRSRILQYMSDIVSSSCSIETKVNAMQGVKRILMLPIDMESSQLKTLVRTVHEGLTDYTIDQRGDIGSLLRLESLEAASSLLDKELDADDRQSIMQLLARLAAEKMVKVRFQAWKCLERYMQDTAHAQIPRTVKHQADVSSFNYFKTLLQLLHQTAIRTQLIAGYISSVTGGTEEVARVSGEALVVYLQEQDKHTQAALITSITNTAIEHMVNTAKKDDREAIPAIEFLAFFAENILGAHVMAFEPGYQDFIENDRFWDPCQITHSPASSLPRTEAMIRLYSSLTLIGVCRPRVLDRLTRLLLHRWPKIRGAAADALFFYVPMDSIKACDWNAPATDNKPAVLALRKELNVAGSASTQQSASVTAAA